MIENQKRLDFSTEMPEARKQWNNAFKVIKKKKVISNWAKLDHSCVIE